MKIIVLHGDDTTKSYERLTKFIDEALKRDWEVLDYDYDSISNQSLFEKERFYILRDVKKVNKEILEKLKNFSGNLVIYHTNKIAATTLKLLNASKVEKFELPKLLWKFLDNLDLKTFNQVVKTEPVELVFHFIQAKMRDIYWVKVGKPKLTPWQISKAKVFANKWSVGKIENIISELAQIDVDSKTGVRQLKSSLDLFLLNIKF